MLHDENRASAFRQVMVSLVVVSLVVATAFAAWWYLSPRPAPPPALRPITAAAQRAERLAWPSLLRGVGELEAVEGVDVASEVAGVIITIAFQPGQVVEKGDLIIQLDATIDRAQLAALKAQEKLAQLRFERQQALARRDIASTEALDAATAELQRLRAEIEAQEEAIEQKSIKAPFSGRLGIRQVSLGQYVQPGQPLVTLQNLDTLYVDFTLPEQVYSRVEAGQTITLHVAGYPEQRFAGTITAINPKIAPSTRNFTVQGTLANPDWRLQPGMFAAVTVQLGDTREVVVLPASAITYNPYGDAVFVLQPAPDSEHHAAGDGAQTVFVAHRIFVKTGETRNDKVEIREGVQPDDLVVTAGQLKLRDNARVLIDDDAQAGGIPVASSRTR
jgi:membrane fusion protein (multidrug efflux system)